MQWTTEKPTAPPIAFKADRFYWYKPAESEKFLGDEPRIVEVLDDLSVKFTESMPYLEVEQLNGEWAGPIPEPEE